jgi:hypothetical protein
MNRVARRFKGMDRTYKVSLQCRSNVAEYDSIRADSRQNAVEILNHRRRLKRPTQDATGREDGAPQMPKEPGFKGTPSITGMSQWLSELGHQVSSPIPDQLAHS